MENVHDLLGRNQTCNYFLNTVLQCISLFTFTQAPPAFSDVSEAPHSPVVAAAKPREHDVALALSCPVERWAMLHTWASLPPGKWGTHCSTLKLLQSCLGISVTFSPPRSLWLAGQLPSFSFFLLFLLFFAALERFSTSPSFLAGIFALCDGLIFFYSLLVTSS